MDTKFAYWVPNVSGGLVAVLTTDAVEREGGHRERGSHNSDREGYGETGNAGNPRAPG